MQTKIILVSHALTDWNMQGKIQGHRDVPLNNIGRQMACLLAEHLKDFEIDRIYCSDLIRTVQTAEPTAALKHLPIFRDMRLREGRSMDQNIQGQYPVLAFYQEFETEEDVLKRMSEVLAEIAINESGKQILVVSHAKAMELFIQDLLLKQAKDPGLYLGKRSALNFLQFSAGQWEIQSLNQADYLEQIRLNC